MLAAETRLYQRRILVVVSKEHTCVDVNLKPDVLTTAAPICIGYVSANHYVFLQPKAREEAGYTSSPTPSSSVGTSTLSGEIVFCNWIVMMGKG